MYNINEVIIIRAQVESIHVSKSENGEYVITYVLNIPSTSNNIFLTEQKLQEVDYNAQ